jgi:dethiobiotin synthetase
MDTLSPIAKGLFITGTDTEVGKTYIGTRLIGHLSKQGISVAPRKPVESGCELINSMLTPSDGLALMQAAGLDQIDVVTPYRFEAALAPPVAASLEGKNIRLMQLIDVCTANPDHFIVVEGAGGFLSPLAHDALNADLAVALKLPVLLVVADRLGCINHCLLTVEAIEHRGLTIAGIALNQMDEETTPGNLEEIRSRVACPVYRDSELDNLISSIVKNK